MEPTDNEIIVPNNDQNDDQQNKDTQKFKELSTKPLAEQTDEDKKELAEIKERYGKNVQKRIDLFTRRAKIAEEKAEQIAREKEVLEQRITALESRPAHHTEFLQGEFVEIDGQRFHTDAVLERMRDEGKLTDTQAYAYQRKRDKAEIKADVFKEISNKKSTESENEIRKADTEKVLAEHPEFSNKHPEHNPDDLLYQKTNELFTEGYRFRPDGLSLALKRAKEILRMFNKRIDRSTDFEIEDTDSLSEVRDRKRQDEIVLSESEKQMAIRQWTTGELINPKTGKEYTDKEALEKALIAKKRRLGRI